MHGSYDVRKVTNGNSVTWSRVLVRGSRCICRGEHGAQGAGGRSGYTTQASSSGHRGARVGLWARVVLHCVRKSSGVEWMDWQGQRLWGCGEVGQSKLV